MSCPNGHKGGVFCCEDNVNKIMVDFLDTKYPNSDETQCIPVGIEQWLTYKKGSDDLMEEADEGPL